MVKKWDSRKAHEMLYLYIFVVECLVISLLSDNVRMAAWHLCSKITLSSVLVESLTITACVHTSTGPCHYLTFVLGIICPAVNRNVSTFCSRIYKWYIYISPFSEQPSYEVCSLNVQHI